MTAISGTRRAFKELVDGSIRVQIDIDPRFKKQFLETFGAIDMPVAIAPLVADFERIEQKEQKGGALSRLAGMWCKDEEFRHFVFENSDLDEVDEDDAAGWIRWICGVTSRADIDNSNDAEIKFHKDIRIPYSEWLKNK